MLIGYDFDCHGKLPAPSSLYKARISIPILLRMLQPSKLAKRILQVSVAGAVFDEYCNASNQLAGENKNINHEIFSG